MSRWGLGLTYILSILEDGKKDLNSLKEETQKIKNEIGTYNQTASEELDSEGFNTEDGTLYDSFQIDVQLDELFIEDETIVTENTENTENTEILEITDPQGGRFDLNNNPYQRLALNFLDRFRALEDPSKNRISPDHRLEFLALKKRWSETFGGLNANIRGQAGLVSKAEFIAFLAAYNQVKIFIDRYLDKDGFFKDIPLNNHQKSVINTVIAEHHPRGIQRLKDILNQSPDLTQQQRLIVQTIIVLGEAFPAAVLRGKDTYNEITNELRIWIDRAVYALILGKKATTLGVALSPLNDVIDICEFVTGKEMCSPKGDDLSDIGRLASGFGWIASQGKFWRFLLDFLGIETKIARRVGDATDDVAGFSADYARSIGLTSDELKRAIASGAKTEAGFRAFKIIDGVKASEKHITSTMKGVVKEVNGQLAGLNNRLKTLDSLTRKIKSDSITQGISLAKAAAKISDALRYTMVIEPASLRL